MCCLNTYTDWLLLGRSKVKAIRCHYYGHIKESVNTDESCGAKDESDGESGDEEYEEEFDSREDESDNDFVFNDLDEKSNSWQTIQFISDDQICEVVVLGSWDVSINTDVTCLDTCILTLAFVVAGIEDGGSWNLAPSNDVWGSNPVCML